MIIGSIQENRSVEKRISITPDIVKKYVGLGCEVQLIKNYGSHIDISDQEYLDFGAKIFNNEDEIIRNSDVIVQVGMIDENKYLYININI